MTTFKILTLIDITKTGARRGENNIAWKQEQNYNTLIGVLGLRVNPTVEQVPRCRKQPTKGMGFGRRYTGQHNIWEFEFEVEYEEALTTAMLEEDFDLIPVINKLNETAKIDPSVFRTNDATNRNIIFKYVDNILDNNK